MMFTRQILFLVILYCIPLSVTASIYLSSDTTQQKKLLAAPVCLAAFTTTIYALIHPQSTAETKLLIGISSLLLAGCVMRCF